MGVGASLYMYDVVVKKFTFTISCPDEFLFVQLCSGWQDFNWHSASRGPSATTMLLVDIATDTVTNWVNVESDILQDALLPSCVLSGAHSRSFWQRTVQLWPDDILMRFMRLLAISGFPVTPGNAEALVGWGRKFTFAQNYQNRFMYVKAIARQTSDIFGDAVYDDDDRDDFVPFCNRQNDVINFASLMTFYFALHKCAHYYY